MSLLRRGLESRSAYPAFSLYSNPLNTLYGNTVFASTAGERVDEITALGIASVLSCVSLLADSVATMPLRAYEDGREVPVPPVLADPDPAESTSFEVIHSTVVAMALHGEGFLHIERSRGGKGRAPVGTPVGLTPLHPVQMQVLPDKESTGRRYLHLGHEVAREDILHIRWMTSPQSLRGISPLASQRTILGLALAMDRYLAQWYGEGGTPSGVLETDKPLTAEAARNLRETWESSQRKHRRPAVLSDGLKWRAVQTSAVDMEFNATREAVLQEVGRIFRIPPYLLGVKSDGMTYMNVEQASINFLIHTLQPWLTRLEIAFSTLLPPGVDVRFDPENLLRLDALTKSRVQMAQIQSGTRTPNEARAVDGLPPYPGGDEFVQVLPGAPLSVDAKVAGIDDDPTSPAMAQAE